MGDLVEPPRRIIAADGTPQAVVWCEQWLVGASMIAAFADVAPLPAIVTDADFHDETLGTIWRAVCRVIADGAEPTLPAVAGWLEWSETIDGIGGETRLATLAFASGAFLYAGAVALAEHARIVHEWGDKRRALDGLSKAAAAVYRKAPGAVDHSNEMVI